MTRHTYHVNRRTMRVQVRDPQTCGRFHTIGMAIQLPMPRPRDHRCRGFIDPGDLTIYTGDDPAGLVRMLYATGMICTLRIIVDSLTFRSEAYLTEVGLSRRGATARFALSGVLTVERKKQRGTRYRKRMR